MDRAVDRPCAGIRVLIVEEQEVIRRGLLAITSAIPEVIATAAGMSSLRDRSALSGVDVTLVSTSVLMNAERAGLTVEQLRPMIVIVPSAQPQHLEIATQQHCDGYIMQADLTSSSLRTAVLQVATGQLAVPEIITLYLLNRVRGHDSMLLTKLYHLRARDAEVLTLLVTGATNKEIASRLHISVHGVKRHVSTLLSQFHSPNRAHLVSHVLRNGMAPSAAFDM